MLCISVNYVYDQFSYGLTVESSFGKLVASLFSFTFSKLWLKYLA